ncbi:MAG TPA: response regulator transcription factor [Armatimonadota bacterium]|jgi:DNA-binding response OmpR family regulator|nr:response regulator transcription factor [Armatimonadota bacterium]
MATRILLVDDERDLVFASKLYLETEGYEIIPAYDGAEALELVQDPATRPDLIILDAWMPRMSGWDALGALRANVELRDIPVIMLTVAAQEADKARGWELGVDWYHTKPFIPEELLAVIERVLQASKDQAEEDRARAGDG